MLKVYNIKKILVSVRDYNNKKTNKPIHIGLKFEEKKRFKIDLSGMKALLKKDLKKRVPKNNYSDDRIYSVSVKTEGKFVNNIYLKTEDLDIIMDKTIIAIGMSEPV